jgi:GT2 family glycosyltransferase/glycosyltransferase involved in cell wall biosynthesis
MTTAVVIPVKDGARYLDELLVALAREQPDEVLVIDSGSTDGSVEIARRHGADVLEIGAGEFGHGRTRNLGVSQTGGELVCFLTQDATPVEGWLGAYRAAFAAHPEVGAAYGPHLPREDTSPMIARELTEFFRTFGPEDEVTIQPPGGVEFLSNVNACYRREALEGIGFRDVPYAEDQAFGRDLLAAGWSKAYVPGAAVLHAHDYSPTGFMRRYFDEYRGLRETTGHREPLQPRAAAGDVRRLVRDDLRWLDERGASSGERARWAGRSVVHHSGRKVFSALGSRADRLPRRLRRALSHEGRDDAAATADGPPRGVVRPAGPPSWPGIGQVLRDGEAPLLPAVEGMAERERLHVAMVIPPFKRGSGGHSIVFQIASRLERMGHTCSAWLIDPYGWQTEREGDLRRMVREYFAPFEGPVFKGTDGWYGADVVLATGWQTVFPALALDQTSARAYLVNDHEPVFYGASAEALWAEETYRRGLYCICGTPWLRDLVIERYGAEACAYDFGVDHDVYRPRPVERRRDTVIFYSRAVTARRAVPLGAVALDELQRRRPEVRIVTFGGNTQQRFGFASEQLGIASPEQLAWAYSEATVGLTLSLSNISLVPKEMLACGLPCVDLAGLSGESVFGEEGPVELVSADPLAIAGALERLLDDRELWQQRSQQGMEFVAGHTWQHAAEQVERGLRTALALRERAGAV